MQVPLIVLFGITGVLSRYFVDRAVGSFSAEFPAGTLAVNIVGSLVAGLVIAAGDRWHLSENLRIGLLVGFCGGFTTMSAFAVQTAGMFQGGRLASAAAYCVANPTLSIVAALIGLILGKRIF